MTSFAAVLARWPRRVLPGGGFTLVSPGGPRVASLCVRSGVRARSLHDLVRSLVDDAGSELSAARRRMAIERLVTCEGLHAAQVSLVATVDGGRVDWTVGVIARDFDLVAVEGTGDGPQVAEWTRRLIGSLAFGVSCSRIQRYVYRPPTAWFGVRRSFATCWLAPGFPRNAAWIAVCDAVPIELGSTVADVSWPLPSSPGHAIERCIDRFRYRIVLNGGGADELGAMHAIADSIEPCPLPASYVKALEWMA